jgi:DNA-binding NtrC family response regulator
MSPKPKIAIGDDSASERARLAASLRADFEISEASDYDSTYQVLREVEPDVLLLDLTMPVGGVRECVELLRELRENDYDTLVIVLSDDTSKSAAMRVMEGGAYDYYIKPVDPDVLRTLVDRAVEKLRVERENRILREEIHRKNSLGDLIGSTDAMREVFDTIRRMARTSTTVVIRGESGTGKELVARAIHDLSQRRNRPFVSVNCAALPESLMEAELFGYERGAFTGAVAMKEGRIELAQRGTLFLDEIATLSQALQSKLLRVLEDHTLVRLGGQRSIRVDFRLLSATNEDLEALVQDGRFREDLYYRIHVVPIFLPPLRERVEDTPLLIDYFMKVYCAANRTPPKRIADDVLQALKGYPWPGNVRELENVVQRMVLMTDGDLITLKDLPGDVVHAAARDSRSRFRLPASGFRLEEEVETYERQWVEAALAQAGGVKAQAAKLLGINKDKLKYLCRKHEL